MSIECAFFGALVRDADSKTSKASGKAYLRFTVRVGDGDDASFVSVRSFDPAALVVADKLVKGARVYCEGKIALDEWTAQDGSKRHGLSVMSFHTHLAAIGKNKPSREHQDEAAARRSAPPDDPIPF